MAEAMRRIEGSCRCGRLRFAVIGDPLVVYACHCRGCQKLTASAFTLSAWFPEARFEFLGGETEIGSIHGEHQQIHCAYCKGWAHTHIAEPPGYVSIRPTLLEEPDAFPVMLDLWLDEALPGVRSGAVRPGGMFVENLAETFADYAALLADHRARTAASVG